MLAGRRFNALGTQEWENDEERPGMLAHPASHSQVTHHGARVAPQRCPILRVSRIKVAGSAECLKEFMVRMDGD